MKTSSIPFPVEVPFAMRPHMKLWDHSDSLLIKDKDFDYYISQKEKYYSPYYGDNVNEELIKSAVNALKKYTEIPISNSETQGLVYKLTFAMQEDFVVMSPNKDGDISAQILSVHFPSGWNPKEKVNLSFSQIHEPLADSDLIKKASDQIINMICKKGPFVRHVWTISNSDQLNRNPNLTVPWTTENLEQMYFRCERQTTIPINNNSMLFLIRVFVVPLLEIFEEQEKKDKIIDSIFSMTDAVLEYKNLKYVKEYLSLHAV